MSNTSPDASTSDHAPRRSAPPSVWHQLIASEDGWSIWLGLGLAAASYALFARGSSLNWIAVTPPRWSTFAQIGAHLGGNWARYAAQFVLWAVLFGVAVKAIGYRLR